MCVWVGRRGVNDLKAEWLKFACFYFEMLTYRHNLILTRTHIYAQIYTNKPIHTHTQPHTDTPTHTHTHTHIHTHAEGPLVTHA